jgi:hypothetical protein
MSDLDTEFMNLLQDNFGTGDEYGRNSMDLESLFNNADTNFVAFDDLANDPILGNLKTEKKALTVVPTPSEAAPTTSVSPACTSISTTATVSPPVQLNFGSLSQATSVVTQPVQNKWTGAANPFVLQNAAVNSTVSKPVAFGKAPHLMPGPAPSNFVFHRQLAPNMIVPNQSLLPKQSPFRCIDLKEKGEEEKKEKKRLAVRKCREKKRKEMKDLETRASTFDEEIRELRQELKRARTEGQPVENSASNLEQVQLLLCALRNQNVAELSAISSTLVSAKCTATTPCSSVEVCGKAAVLEHFKWLASSFSVANFLIQTEDCNAVDCAIRCKWSLHAKQTAVAFGIHTDPHTAKPIAVEGGCRFTFRGGKIVDIVCTWDHSALVLQLLGIPPLQI